MSEHSTSHTSSTPEPQAAAVFGASPARVGHHSRDGHAVHPAPQPAAVFAAFHTPAELIAAARKTREAGYANFDAHSPFPVHGIDDAIGIRPTRLPFFTLVAACVGFVTALAMQWWMNGVAYPFLISGKPLISIPASWPVAFELTVLFSAFTTVIAMILLNGLPRFSNPLLSDEKFLRSTSDQFVLSIDARDPKFGGALDHLRGLGTVPETVYTDPGSKALPKIIPLAGLIIVSAMMIPPVLIAKARVSTKSVPRWHFIWDMDFQPKFKAQRENLLFTDLRAMRPQEPGTIARGELEADDAFYRGLKSDEDGAVEAAQVSRQVVAQAQPADATQPADGAAAPADGAAAPADGGPPPDPLDKLPWVTEFPVAVTGQLMKRGQERYDIYCSTCHGLAGDGDGLITQRAMELEQGTWIRPVTYHSDAIRNQPVGRLFNTITNGVRKMPPMGDVIPPEDRWAILLYMRALQRSRNATPADVPTDVLPQLKDVPQ